MSKEETKDNSCGITAVVLGILSIVFAGLNGLALSIITLVFASKQKPKTKWARAGKILGIIGLILSIIAIISMVWLYQNPSVLEQLTSLQ
jgi:multisubunit Na+/H+ antiporter MnhG subunit